MVLTIIICTLLAARIYRLGVLMYGQKPGLASAVKLLRKQ
jgi:ABC-2 type transport system permease protein